MPLFNKRKLPLTIEDAMERSISVIYKINNSYLDAKAKYLKSREQDCTAYTQNFFEYMLDYWEQARTSIIDNYKQNSSMEDKMYMNSITNAKDIFWNSYVKLYPEEAIKKYDDVFDKNFESTNKKFNEMVFEFADQANSGMTIEVPKIIFEFYNLIQAVHNFHFISDYKDVIFALSENIRWDNYNEYVIDKKVYEMPISSIKNLKKEVVALKKNTDEIIKNQAKEYKKLSKIEGLFNQNKREVPADLLYNLENIQKAYQANVQAKVGIAEYEYKINLLFNRTLNCEKRFGDSRGDKISIAFCSAIVSLFGGDSMYQYNHTTEKPREFIYVSKRELDDVLTDGMKYYSLLPTIANIAKVTNHPVVVPELMQNYATTYIQFIDEINYELIAQEVDKIAQVENKTREEILEKMSDEEVETFGLPKDDLMSIHFETKNGTFQYDGFDLHNAKTNEIVPFDQYAELDQIFGVVNTNENDMTLES